MFSPTSGAASDEESWRGLTAMFDEYPFENPTVASKAVNRTFVRAVDMRVGPQTRLGKKMRFTEDEIAELNTLLTSSAPAWIPECILSGHSRLTHFDPTSDIAHTCEGVFELTHANGCVIVEAFSVKHRTLTIRQLVGAKGV